MKNCNLMSHVYVTHTFMFIHIGVNNLKPIKLFLTLCTSYYKFENSQLTKWSIFRLSESTQCFTYLAKAKITVNIIYTPIVNFQENIKSCG